MSENVSNSAAVKQGAIVYIDDSEDDQMIFEMALRETGIKNKLITFNNGVDALIFLKSTEDIPFIIISDVNMPRMDGFALKAAIEEDKVLSLKAIPFIYLSTSSARKDVKTAYYHQAQGYFEKPSSIEVLARNLKLIIDYWSTSELPSYY